VTGGEHITTVIALIRNGHRDRIPGVHGCLHGQFMEDAMVIGAGSHIHRNDESSTTLHIPHDGLGVVPWSIDPLGRHLVRIRVREIPLLSAFGDPFLCPLDATMEIGELLPT